MNGYEKDAIEHEDDHRLDQVIAVVVIVYGVLFGFGLVVSIANLMLRVGCVK